MTCDHMAKQLPDHFNDLLRNFLNERKKCIIMADFHIDLLKIDTHGQTTDYIHIMFASVFYPTISRPERVTQQTATLKDNIITNMHEPSNRRKRVEFTENLRDRTQEWSYVGDGNRYTRTQMELGRS